MKKQTSNTTYILLVVAIVLLVNFLSDHFFVRLDFTADQRYTLSQPTRDILKDLDKPVTVTAYISKELPPQFARVRREFKEELTEYASRSGGHVVYELINPNKDEQEEQKAMQQGINPVLINVRDKDQVKQQKAYMGAVLQYGDKKEVIPFIEPGAAMEYSLTTAIKKMTVQDKPRIGFIEGNGTAPINSMIQAMQALSILNNIEPVNLNDSLVDLKSFKVLVMVGPTDTLPPVLFENLNRYLAEGGNLYIAMNRVRGDLQQVRGLEITTGLEQWLEQFGLRVNADMIIDQQCGTIMVTQQQGMMNFRTSVNFPYLPMVTSFSDHPVTKGLSSIVFPFVSSIDYTGSEQDREYISLVTSSERSGREATPLMFDINRQWAPANFPESNLTIACLLSGNLIGNTPSRIMLVSDADFPINGSGNQAREISQDQVNLFVNGIEWLADDTGLIDLRTKEVTSRPLDQLEDGTRAWLKYLNFLLPVILIIVIGIVRWQYRNSLRLKRMNEDYF
jgi:gliding-associated putative ABC transporter substrate-binding component GldG